MRFFTTRLMFAVSLLIPATAAHAQATPKPDAEAAWKAVATRLQALDREAVAAINATLAEHLDPLFAEAKKGIKPFADSVLSLEGKLAYAESAADTAFDRIAEPLTELFGGDTTSYFLRRMGPDAFTRFVQERFDKHLLNAERLQRASDAAIRAYAAKLTELENNLLVELRADLPDGAIPAGPLPVAPELPIHWGITNGAVAAIVKDAGADLGVTLLREAVSWYAGDKLADQFTSKKDPFLKQAAANLIAGQQVDAAINAGIGMTGYDPAAKIAAQATEALDVLRGYAYGGDDDEGQLHTHLLLLALAYPDPAVRKASGEAMKALEAHTQLGLGHVMNAMQIRRTFARFPVLYRLVHGAQASVPPLIGFDKSDAETTQALLREAREIAKEYSEEGVEP